jgi:uncharacterized protein YndB with AHSA1/START domain
MNNRSVVHGTFVIERNYDASAARVFAAWAAPEVKANWFVGPENWTSVRRELDFRVGGKEVLHGRFAGGSETFFAARYHDIVQGERIVFVYDMHHNGKHQSVSLATVEITPIGENARLVFTEQVVFLDGNDCTASRERGTAAHLDRIAEQLRRSH